MNIHTLLQKQMDSHLTFDYLENPSFQVFIQSVNSSYFAFESEKEIMDHSFQEREKGYYTSNDQLKKEIELHQIAVDSICQIINKDDLTDGIKHEYKYDLFHISEYVWLQKNERISTEKALLANRKELEDYKFAMDQSAIIAITNAQGIIKTVNDKFCELSQYSRDELIGNTHQIINSKFHPKAFFSEIWEHISSGNVWRGVIKNKKKNGDYYWVDTTIVPFLDGNNRPLQYLAIRFDVTASKIAENEIIKAKELSEVSEAHNRLIMDSSLNSIVCTDTAKRITFWNPQAELIFGWKKEEVLGQLMVDLVIPVRYRGMWHTAMDHHPKNETSPYFNKQLELKLIDKAGREFYVQASLTPIVLGEINYFCAFIQDISERKEAEKQLSQTVALLKILTANLQSEILFEDQNRKLLFVNQLFCDRHNIRISPEQLQGTDCTPLMEMVKESFKNSETFVSRVNEILSAKKNVIGELLETTDHRFVEREYFHILDEKPFEGHLWNYKDVTQKRWGQQLLEQSEERSALIMSSSISAIINVDHAGLITFWNHHAEIVFGYKARETVGMPLSEIILADQNKNIYDTKNSHHIRKDLQSDFYKHIELIGVKKDGEEITLDCSIIPIQQNESSFYCLFIHDISEKKEIEKIRKIQEEKYQSLITHMNLGLLEVDNSDTIQYANQSFVSMSGFELKELIGKKTSAFFMHGDNLETIKAKNEVRKQGDSDTYQFLIKNKKGDLRWWSVSGAPNYDSKGNVIGSISIHLDITEQKQLEIDLEKEKTSALVSSKAKEVFLANMSHEIRTPLNAIVGFLRELEKQELSEIQRKYITNSSIASKHLLAIINNILDISKIEAGEMSLEAVDFDFIKSISNVTAVLHPMLEQKGLDLNVTISNKIKNILNGDALRLQQILFNLIGNAIKFTSKGSISLNCQVVEDDALFQNLKITISDTGIGMEDDFIEAIFNKFAQADSNISRKYGGTGLGLSITKELVKLMEGKIEIESKKNSGTRVYIYLKFNKGSENGFENSHDDDQVLRIDNISVLLVEDNYLNRMVVQNSLQYYNCRVTEAENGAEAIEILKKIKFDIILMDIQMPEMGGIEATEIIRKSLNISTPIVALTANAFKSEIIKCKKAGMDDYVSKPFDEDVLIATIAKHTVNKKTSIPEVILLERSSTNCLYNLTSLQNLGRGDEKFVNKMIKIFIEQTTDVLAKIAEAIFVSDFLEISRLIHKIKPSVESLGIISIMSEIILLEKIAKIAINKNEIIALYSTIKEVLERAIVQLKEQN